MTPVSLNPPGPNSLLQGQNQFFNISPVNQDTPTFFNLLGDFGENYDHHHQDHKLAFHHDGSSSSNHQQQLYNSSSESVMVDSSSARDTNLSSSLELEDSSKKNSHGSEKWISSKMRLMNKMINTTATVATTPIMRPNNSIAATTDKAIKTTTPMMSPSNFGTSPRNQNVRYSQTSPSSNSGNNTVRVCSDCSTSHTPLWRSGPMGPKSLCNACGIRQRKARRAMAEAANGLATSPKTKVLKIKKPTQFKTKNKASTSTSSTSTTSAGSSSQDVKKLESFALDYDYDEAATAARLLVDISSGVTY
uniref:GATA-type domain-containing protein n=1 Tax=Medicago truncatula TaxID=3880 RepID=B7FH17_MEDTR|nr:unknown [Medicago truncatula]